MRYIVFLFVLLSCAKEDIKVLPQCVTCFNMTISDSLPIQFWINGVQTHNQRVICGLAKQDCFCQPFNCDDEITIQFQDDEYDEYELSVINEADEVLSTIIFTEISAGVWQATFTPSESSPAICERIKFEINGYALEMQQFINYEFNATLNPWSQTTNFGEFWVWFTGNIAQTNSDTPDPNTEVLFQNNNGNGWPIGDYTMEYKATNNSTGGLAPLQSGLKVVGSNDGVNFTDITYTGDGVVAVGEVEVVNTVSFNLATQYQYLGFWWSKSGPGSGYDVYLDIYYYQLTESPLTRVLPATLLATSDCIDLRQSHDCTELISYTNSTDFDDLVYTDSSPATVFYLRIPATFNQEENPQTQEDSELSNGVIITRRQTIVEKTLLETGYLPNYMHKKLQKVLMHETIILTDKSTGLSTQWKRRDPYEPNPIKKYNLKMASVLLTKYNSVERNTI